MTTHQYRFAEATHPSSPRRPWAVGLIACGQLLIVSSSFVSLGCQGPFKLWRKDEPSIEQLLAAPQPWDAEVQSRAGSNLSPQPAGSAARGSANASRSTAANASSSGPNYNVSKRDPRLEEMNEEELQAALAEVPANMRPLIKRQWEASRAHALAQKSQQKGQQKSQAEDLNSGSATGQASTKSSDGDIRLVDLKRQKESSGASGSTTYRLSDTEDSKLVEVDGSDVDALGNDPVTAQKTAAASRNGSGKKSTPDSVHQTLRDEATEEWEHVDSQGEMAVPRVAAKSTDNMRKMVQNVAPPGAKKTPRQVPHATPVDTGFEDNSTALMAVQSTHQPSDVALASEASSRHTGDGKVAKASAESKGPAGAKGQVVPASSNATASTDTSRDTSLAEKIVPAPTTSDEAARLMLRLIQEERKKAIDESPSQQLRRELCERYLHVHLGQLDPALRPIDALQPDLREYFRYEFQAIFNAIDPNGNPDMARRCALIMDNERRGLAHLGAMSPLEVKNAAFCTNVDGYASVTKFPTNQFKPGAELLLYCEVDNFASEQVKDGYQTMLQGSYYILDANGARIADVLLPQEVDNCKRPRRDYFFVYRIYLPQTIAPGRYQMQLSIEDMKARKFAQSTVDFQIAN